MFISRVFSVALLLAIATPSWASDLPALSAEQKATFWGSPQDPAAEKLLGINEEFEGKHYATGDEWHAELWQPHIANLGGGYVGVGSDQAYLYVGWQRPEFAWLIDYDQLVVDLHSVYRAFFLEADSIDGFLKLWQAGSSNLALDRIEHTYASDKRLKIYREAYSRNRGNVAYRLALLRKSHQKNKVASWLTDPAAYAYIRNLYQTERIRPMLANLLADKGISGIAAAADKLGVKVHVVYLSNAEEYWPYGQQFRANLKSLPFDDKSKILRTLSSFSINRDYRYNLQPGLLYQKWLAQPKLRGVRAMVKRRKLDGPDDIEFSITDSDPEAAPAKKPGKK